MLYPNRQIKEMKENLFKQSVIHPSIEMPFDKDKNRRWKFSSIPEECVII